ncbi:MAG: acyl-CoA/acyl-ACP dehydrogenase [Desulfobacterales bacterium]|nr:acyl-CoA/acyl-ACP dehydrogenase [Desulfobacterales bacterium]
MVELNRSQKQIQKAASDFARGEFDKDLALEMESANEFPEKIWKKAADLGFIGVHFPEAFSGGGMGMMDACLISEAFCRKDSSMGTALSLSTAGAECLVRFGGEATKEAFLPKIAEGKIRCGYGFFEPGCGADLTGVETIAAERDGHWIINGTKTHVLNGGVAGVYVILCRTDPEAPAEKGLSLFAVEGDRPGIKAVNAGRKLGANMIATADLTFTDLKLPAENLLGKAGRGLAQAESFFQEAGILIAAQCLGTAAGAFDRALAYTKEREQFNRKLAVFEITRQKIADMAIRIEQARLITYEAARRSDAGGKGMDNLGFMARLTAARTAVDVADEAIQLFGGYGYMKESEVERFYRDAKIAALSLGGATRLKNRIATDVIGKIK